MSIETTWESPIRTTPSSIERNCAFEVEEGIRPPRLTHLSAALTFLGLGGILLFAVSGSYAPKYLAESLVFVSPFTNAFLVRDFERQMIKANLGLARLQFQTQIETTTTLKGTTTECNGVIRVMAVGRSRAEAESAVSRASEKIINTARRLYGTVGTVFDQPRSRASSEARQPFKFNIGPARPGPFLVAGRVFYPDAKISFNVGKDWVRYYDGRFSKTGFWPSCMPLLTGMGPFNGASMRAFPLGPTRTNAQAGILHFREQADKDQGFVSTSWKEAPFTTESGLYGVRISFVRQYPVPNWAQGGTKLMRQTSQIYVFTNACSRCVALEYDTISGTESAKIQEMLQKTLRAD